MSRKLARTKTEPEIPVAERLAPPLLAWFAEHSRDLPWRKSRDLYRIWISEIMLQQTQVATVIDYFQRFTQAFPTVKSLAAAEETEVLRLWEGLGYYRRARQLHAAAKKIVAEHGGRFPQTFDEVRALPGIGRYTAGAILSIGLDERVPILEANTVRLFARLTAFQNDPHSNAGQKYLWEFAEQILPQQKVGAFNQSLMELGSLICTPRNPRCTECPVAHLCAAKRLNLQAEIPLPKKKMVFEDVTEVAVVVRDGDRVLLRRRQPGERWAGLWDFVRFGLTEDQEASHEDAVKTQAEKISACQLRTLVPLKTIKHGVTRFRITLHCFVADVKVAGGKRTKQTSPAGDHTWVAMNELETYPLSVTGREIARLLPSAPANPPTKSKKTSRQAPAVQTPVQNVRSRGSSRRRAT